MNDEVPSHVLKDISLAIDTEVEELREKVDLMRRHINTLEQTNDRLLRIIENLSSRRYE